MQGYWYNPAYFDSLEQTRSPNALAVQPAVALYFAKGKKTEGWIIDSDLTRTVDSLEMDANNQLAFRKVTQTRFDYLNLSADSSTLTLHDLQTQQKINFLRLPPPCLYDDRPTAIESYIRCLLNERLLYGQYYWLNEQNQPTNRLVVLNNGGAIRGIDPTFESFAVCMHINCRRLSERDLLRITFADDIGPKRGDIQAWRYYGWERNGDTMTLYKMKNIGTADSAKLVDDQVFAKLIKRKV